MKPIVLKQHSIGEGLAPFVIAELSGNHNQSIDRALQIVDAAAKAGAQGVKLQTYTADTMTIDCQQADFVVSGTSEQWQDRTLYDLYNEAHTPWEWHQAIFERCYELGMTPFSTPFDETAVDFLESLNMEIYKIASFEMTDIPLLRKVASTGKPIIMSTGMASQEEIELAVTTLRKANCEQFVLLKCTSAYPARYEDANAQTIPYLAKKYGCLSGLSDHTMGAAVPVTATALGATVIEKHLTLERDDGGVDSHFSMEPLEFKQMVELVQQSYAALGSVQTQPSTAELACRNYRRSIYAVKDIAEGEVFTHENLRIIRPGFGLAPNELDNVLGKTASQPLVRGTALQLKMLQQP
ncbi:pseudaminic acid synthase [Glaciecola sp. SC05]|uniref:pseudaminic acid synthase n=1 Tax=Glaciecola sp. SC05 TaxID=1987355 RepID=UPI003529CD04